MAHPMYPPCRQCASWDGKLRPFLRSIESHFLECHSKSGAVLPPLRNEPPICRPNDRGQPYNAVLSIHLWRALHPATYVSAVADQYGGFCLNARGGRPRKDFWAAEVAKPFMVLIVKPCVKLIFSLFSLPNRASASEIILSSKEAGAAPTYLRGRRMNDWTKIVYIKYPTNGKQTGVIRQTQGGETQRRKCCTMTRRAR